MKGREHIALLSTKGGIGVEIGVATGQLTQKFVELGHFSQLYAVDKWDDHHDIGEYNKAVRLLEPYENVHVCRDEAKHWLSKQEDESFDFIYIDCYAHTGQEDGKMLEASYPKLKTGGLFSGDDYDSKYPRTIRCVDAFADSKNKTVLLYDAHMHSGAKLTTWDRSPSWYFRK